MSGGWRDALGHERRDVLYIFVEQFQMYPFGTIGFIFFICFFLPVGQTFIKRFIMVILFGALEPIYELLALTNEGQEGEGRFSVDGPRFIANLLDEG